MYANLEGVKIIDIVNGCIVLLWLSIIQCLYCIVESVYLNLESAKSQINEMLQKMDLTAIVEFDRWLKRIKISRDPRTGKWG